MPIVHDNNRPIYHLPKQHGASVEIGRRNDHGGKVWPHARSEKWAGRCWLEISARGSAPRPGRPERLLAGDSILEIDCQRKKGNKTVGETHRIKTGSLKWEVVYNSISDLPEQFAVFDLSNPPGLEFFHQPALTQAEIDEGHVRPDNVVNSYAAYWPQSGRILLADGTERVNYETGKYCHIYRPEWVAANGQRIWGEQAIVDGELRITVPLPWIQSLGSAAFPLVLDPTFGYTGTGASAAAHAAGSVAAYGLFSPASNGNISHVSVYSQYSGSKFTAGLYTDSSGYPDSKIVDGAEETTVNNDWVHSSMDSTPSVTAGTNYWLADGCNATTNVSHQYDNSATYDMKYAPSGGYSAGTLPATFPGSATNYDRRYSIYATYTEPATSKGRCIGGGVF